MAYAFSPNPSKVTSTSEEKSRPYTHTQHLIIDRSIKKRAWAATNAIDKSALNNLEYTQVENSAHVIKRRSGNGIRFFSQSEQSNIDQRREEPTITHAHTHTQTNCNN